jgi:hypothetical protein
MLPFLAEMRELVTAIRIQERVGGTLWDRALRPPLPSLIAFPSPNCSDLSPKSGTWGSGRKGNK